MRTMIFLAICLLISSCGPNETEDGATPSPVVDTVAEFNGYRFWVAGHVYGKPTNPDAGDSTRSGIHPPFLAEFPTLNADPKMKFGVLTGDMVHQADSAHWAAFDEDIKNFNMPIHAVSGNHDYYGPKPFRQHIGAMEGYIFEGDDLFVRWDAITTPWHIDSMQIVRFDSVVAATKPKRIFNFFHQCVFWSPDGIYNQFQPNWSGDYGPQANFHSKVLPQLKATQVPCYVFCGDVGVFQEHAWFAAEDDNVLFIASGMAGTPKDNYVQVDVSDTSVVIRPISLTNQQELFPKGVSLKPPR